MNVSKEVEEKYNATSLETNSRKLHLAVFSPDNSDLVHTNEAC